MNKTYKWKPNSRMSGDVKIVGQAIDKIRAMTGGIASTKHILIAASDPQSPLHRYFEWDNTLAAEQWRLEQARNLAQSIEVVFTDRPDILPTRAYVSIENAGERGYMEISDVMQNTELREQLLNQAMNDAEHFHNKYNNLVELEPIFKAVRKVRSKQNVKSSPQTIRRDSYASK